MTQPITTSRAINIAIGVFFGFLVGIIVSQHHVVTLDGALTFGNILQATTTLVVALAVSHYLQRQAASARKEQELVLRHYDHAIESLDKLGATGRQVPLVELTALLKRIAADCRAAGDLLVVLGLEAAEIQHRGTDALLREIRRLATETPKAPAVGTTEQNPPLVVNEGVITFSTDHLALLDTKIHQLRMRLLRCEVAINRA